MAKKIQTDDAEKRPIGMNGAGDTSGHTEDIDGAAVPRDLSHDLPSAAAILRAADDLDALGAAAREAEVRWATHTDECPYCRATTIERLTPTLLECRTCESVYRPGYDPASLFRMPDVAVLRPFRHMMKRRQIIERDYACHTPTGLVRVAERLGYVVARHTPSMLHFIRPVQSGPEV
jgi:ribosomal protein L37AE/L43A